MTRASNMTKEEAALVRLRLMAHRAFGAMVENRRGGGEEAQKDLDAIDWAIATTQSIAALRQGWVRTAERVPEGDEHKDILGLYKGKDYYLYDIVQIGWLRLHPEMYPYWTDLPAKPE